MSSNISIHTSTLVRGSKETIIRILNAVICNTGNSKRICMDDDVETINHKIQSEGDNGELVFYRHDLLDKKVVSDKKIQEKRFAYEDNGYRPEEATQIDCVRTYGAEYAIDFGESEMEYEPYHDWVDWEDICRLYDCTIFSDVFVWDSGRTHQHTDLYEKVGDDEVKTTHFSHGQDIWRIYNWPNALIEIDPNRYLPLKIANLRVLEEEIHEQINYETINLIKANLIKTNGHAVIPKEVDYIVDYAFQGCTKLKSIELHDGIKFIGCYAFAGCTNLQNITIPEGAEIGYNAFKDCLCGPKDEPISCDDDEDEWITKLFMN